MVVRAKRKDTNQTQSESIRYKYTSTMFEIEVIESKKAPKWAFLF